jgi:uncharacterized membrane protein YdbT with pleckstrin-like domain
MGYIDKTLGSNERVLYRAHIHSLFYARIWALFIVLVAIIVWLRFHFSEYIGTYSALILLALSAYFCFRLILPLWTLEIALTNLRIVMKRGFIVRSTHELELKAVEEVNMRQSVLGRILDYGTLDVRGIGDVDDLIINGVSDPIALRTQIASAAQLLSEDRARRR